MDAAQLRIIYVFTDLVLPLALGYYLHQKQIISNKANNFLIHFNIIVVYTLLSLLSFWVLPLSPRLLWLPVFGILYAVIPGGLALLTFARRYRSDLDRGAYVMSAMLANIGTLGGLCGFILYNEIGFAYVQLVATFQNLLLVALCFPMAQYYYARHTAAQTHTRLHLSLREMFLSWNQLALLGMLAGMLLKSSGVERPPLLGSLFQSLVHIGAWISLLPVGYLMDFHRARLYYRQILDLLPLRFIIMPGIIYGLIRQLFTDQVLLGTLMIVAATPTAINAVVTSRLYKLNVDLAIAAFLLTTAVFLLLVFPLLFFYIQSGGTF